MFCTSRVVSENGVEFDTGDFGSPQNLEIAVLSDFILVPGDRYLVFDSHNGRPIDDPTLQSAVDGADESSLNRGELR